MVSGHWSLLKGEQMRKRMREKKILRKGASKQGWRWLSL
jgi:hypothetical protein